MQCFAFVESIKVAHQQCKIIWPTPVSAFPKLKKNKCICILRFFECTWQAKLFLRLQTSISTRPRAPYHGWQWFSCMLRNSLPFYIFLPEKGDRACMFWWHCSLFIFFFFFKINLKCGEAKTCVLQTLQQVNTPACFLPRGRFADLPPFCQQTAPTAPGVLISAMCWFSLCTDRALQLRLHRCTFGQKYISAFLIFRSQGSSREFQVTQVKSSHCRGWTSHESDKNLIIFPRFHLHIFTDRVHTLTSISTL